MRTVFGAVLTAVVLALVPGATAGAADPSLLPTQAYATISAGKQINVGPAAQTVHVSWRFADGGAQVPVPAMESCSLTVPRDAALRASTRCRPAVESSLRRHVSYA